MEIDSKKTARIFYDNLTQISRLFWMPAIDLESPVREFREFIDDACTDDLIKAFGHEDLFEPLREEEGEDEMWYDMVAGILAEHFRDGFLATLNIPMRSNFMEGGGCWVNSGITYTHTVYVDDLQQLTEKAIELSNYYKEVDKKKDGVVTKK